MNPNWSNTVAGEDKKGDELVFVQKNRIFFYSPISEATALKLNTNLILLDSENLNHQKVYSTDSPPSIFLHINSPGGYVFEALAVVDTIRNCKTKVVSIIEGNAASGAALIAVSCNHRIISPHATMLIHELTSWFGGKYKEWKDQQRNIDLLMFLIKKILLAHAKIPQDLLDGILSHDIYWDAEECKKYG